MSNNYTQLSFVAPMPEEHVEWCIAVHRICVRCFDTPDSEMDSFTASAPSEYTSILRRLRGHEYAGVEMSAHPGGLWINGEEIACVEYVAGFLREYLSHFELKNQVIGFTWADTCSKPRLDEFSGGGCVVGYYDAKFMAADSWVHETLKEMKESVKPS